MELWQAILVAIGGNAAILLVIAFLGRTLISNFFSKDLERFKAALQIAAIEHQVQFSKLHEKRAEVIAELYRLLVVATWEAESLASPFESAGEPNKREKYGKAMDAILDYFRFFNQHRIYVPDRLCESLQAFVEKLRLPIVDFGVYLRIEHPNETSVEGKFKAWDAAWKSVKEDIPPLRRAIEQEFRSLLGAASRSIM